MSIATFCRLELGLSQRDVAEAVGVSDASVSMWETGRRTPSESNLLRSVQVLASYACAQGRSDLVEMMLGDRAEEISAEWFPIVPPPIAEEIEDAEI